MDTTPNPKQTDSRDVLAARADEELAHAYEQIARADEQIARAEKQLSKLERHAVPGNRPMFDRPAVRGLTGLLLAGCIGVAAMAWQSPYRDAAKEVIARWAPQRVVTSSPPIENPGLPAQSGPPTVQAAAATTAPPRPAPPAQTVPEDVAPTGTSNAANPNSVPAEAVLAAIADRPAKFACKNPEALGIARVVEIDTTGGPGFGFEHFKQLDFLRDKEVVLTFDDGPWLNNTSAVLKALADQCTTGIFFPIGKHATYYPEILKQVASAGHTIGAHTWSHANLNNKKLTEQQRKDEIEKGFSAVKWALGAAPSPFFRFPALQHPPEMVTYLGKRNIAIFSCDLDSFDFKARSSQQVIDAVMNKLDKLGKGIILLHDFQKHTAEALPALLLRLKAGSYKVVQMKAKAPTQTIAEYDDGIIKDVRLPTVSTRPLNSVVQTVSE